MSNRIANICPRNHSSPDYGDCRQEHGLALEMVAEECTSDRNIVLTAVRENGLALRYAGDACKADRQIVLAAVMEHGFDFHYSIT
eukprot:4866898-Amphidinium_carterae.1